MRIGIFTGGGDCPGLNAVIRAVCRTAFYYKFEVYGFRRGWAGVIEKDYEKMDYKSISGILHRGGTILRTSRTNPFKVPDGPKLIRKHLKELKIDALIAIGGEDTLGAAAKLYESGVKVVGVPKTIDNDLNATDVTFGFDSAINVATEAIDRLHTTAESHHRTIVVEVMGRHAGWIALESGVAGGADYILIPERPFDIKELCNSIKRRHAHGKTFSIVVVAEGAKPKDMKDFIEQSQEKDAYGHTRLGGIGNYLAHEIEKITGFETREVSLGHIIRGGSPTAFDRFLGTRFGVKAVELVRQKKFGQMVCLKGTDIKTVSLKKATEKIKTVSPSLYKEAQFFFY